MLRTVCFTNHHSWHAIKIYYRPMHSTIFVPVDSIQIWCVTIVVPTCSRPIDGTIRTRQGIIISIPRGKLVALLPLKCILCRPIERPKLLQRILFILAADREITIPCVHILSSEIFQLHQQLVIKVHRSIVAVLDHPRASSEAARFAISQKRFIIYVGSLHDVLAGLLR